MKRNLCTSMLVLGLLVVVSVVWWRSTPIDNDTAAPSVSIESGSAAMTSPDAAAQKSASPTPATPRPSVSFASLDGSETFTVPQPGDPEYDDYLEMLAHPRVRTSIQKSPGYALPYDPEWRSMVTGRREVAERELHLRDGSTSLDELGHALLAGLQAADAHQLYEQRIDEDEFGSMLWPEFPQSRPYLKIPLWEAWGFNHAKSVSGIRAALQQYGNRKLQLVEVEHGKVQRFTNFNLLNDVRIRARDIDNGETVELAILPAVIECNGTYKALNFEG